MQFGSASPLTRAFAILDHWTGLQVIDGNIPVFAIAAHNENGPVFNRVYKASGEGFSPQHGNAPLFDIGSLSKTVTVAAIFKLAEQGRVRLNDHFLDFFPEVHVPRASPLQQVTLLNLMRHQSPLAKMEGAIKGRQAIDPDELLRELAGTKLKAMGKGLGKWDYSNFGIALLGLVIKRVASERTEEYVTKHLLRPHGLTRDIFPAIATMAPVDRARILIGNDLDKFGQPICIKPADRQALNASGGYIASAAGIAQFYHLLLTGEVLSRRHTWMLHKATISFGPPNGKMRYSFALHHIPIETNGTDHHVGHAGIKKGFQVLSGRSASLGLTIALMTNAPNLPPDNQHDYQGHVALLSMGLGLFRMLNAVAKGPEKMISLPLSLTSIRRPSIPYGFNPECSP